MDIDRRSFLKGAIVAGAAMTLSFPFPGASALAGERKKSLEGLRFFLDTHDTARKTFPAAITPREFEGFFAKYETACQAEGVIPVRLHVGYDAGRAFCLTMARDQSAVKRAHDRVGLPYDSITEVAMATPGDAFFRRGA